jgi:hypothetical protein
VCIKCCCDGCGTCPCSCDPCCDCDCVCPPIDPPIEPPGEIIPDPDPLCLIGGGGLGFEHGNLIELWFSAKASSCARDYYLGSPSINWSDEFGCNDLDGFHGEADLFPPGDTEVTQAAFYVKRNS